jgi:hypothetical protein
MKAPRILCLLLALSVSSQIVFESRVAYALTKIKRVHIVVRNDRSQEIMLRCGPEVRVLGSKQAVALTLSEGDTVRAEQAFGSYQQGEILVQVSKHQEGATLGVR